MIRLGLTGSIGMGKSTTAKMFGDAGIPVHDSDATVHKLYSGSAVSLIEAAFPGTVKDGAVDRRALSAHVVGNPQALKLLEEIVHPLVAEDERLFVATHEAEGTPLVVLDIPLLFEVDAMDRVDAILVVTASPEVQRERVLARDGMTEDKFLALLSKQMPDLEKRRRADYLIDTTLGMDCALAKVDDLITVLTASAVASDQAETVATA